MADLPRSIPVRPEKAREQWTGEDGMRRVEITVEQEFCSVEIERVTVQIPSRCPHCGQDFTKHGKL